MSDDELRSTRRLELGLRGPPRPRPHAPRDGRAVCCAGRLAEAGRSRPRRDVMRRGRRARATTRRARDPVRAARRRARPDDRGDRRRRAAARVPAPPARPLDRLHGRGRRRPPAVHAPAARRLPAQLTASEKPSRDPQWSPDGRRLAYVRDDEIWVVEADGSRRHAVVGARQGTAPRWSPDGLRLAFLSRRRGWSRSGSSMRRPAPRRPPRDPRPPEADGPDRPGLDVEGLAWSPDGRGSRHRASGAGRTPTAQIAIVDVATGDERSSPANGRYASRPDGCRRRPALHETPTAGSRSSGSPPTAATGSS